MDHRERGRTDMTDKPVGRRDCQSIKDDQDHFREPVAAVVPSRPGFSDHLVRTPVAI